MDSTGDPGGASSNLLPIRHFLYSNKALVGGTGSTEAANSKKTIPIKHHHHSVGI
ncbi:hypothetical protein [Sphingobium sp.]|uniref:hypothetical protein n=1 Tax=Sphingobium sp. TaxID=1912891 RepID=UPI002E21D295